MLSARAASSLPLLSFGVPPRLFSKFPKVFYFHEHLPRMAQASSQLIPSPEKPMASKLGRPSTGALEIDNFSIEGVSVGGQETCILIPAFKIAFDIGRCPQRAVSHDFLFISHAHMDHIVSLFVPIPVCGFLKGFRMQAKLNYTIVVAQGGICMYVATRGLFKMKPPTVIVPKCLKPTVEKLFDVHRELDGSELKHRLIGLDVGLLSFPMLDLQLLLRQSSFNPHVLLLPRRLVKNLTWARI